MNPYRYTRFQVIILDKIIFTILSYALTRDILVTNFINRGESSGGCLKWETELREDAPSVSSAF